MKRLLVRNVYDAKGIEGRCRMEDREKLVLHALEAHGDAVMRLALSQTLNAADAEDVAQDVFLRLMTRAPSFASEAHLEAWLMRVTVNRCRDLFRTRKRHRAASIDELPFEPPCPDDGGARESLQTAWDAIAQLTDDERAIAHLVCFEKKRTARRQVRSACPKTPSACGSTASARSCERRETKKIEQQIRRS